MIKFVYLRSGRASDLTENGTAFRDRLPETVGVTSIEAEVGRYWLPFCTTVTAFWGFDSEGRLIDVWVWKTPDAP